MSKISTGVRFDPHVVEAVDTIAKRTGLTASRVYNELVTDRLIQLGELYVTPLIDPVDQIEYRQAGAE